MLHFQISHFNKVFIFGIAIIGLLLSSMQPLWASPTDLSSEDLEIQKRIKSKDSKRRMTTRSQSKVSKKNTAAKNKKRMECFYFALQYEEEGDFPFAIAYYNQASKLSRRSTERQFFLEEAKRLRAQKYKVKTLRSRQYS